MRTRFGKQTGKDSAGLQSGSSAVFVVESPFQVLSAIEAKHFYGFENNILLVTYTVRKERKRNRDQIFKAVELDDWDSVIVWRTGIGFWKTKALIDYFRFRQIGAQLPSKCKALFLGEFRSAAMHRMRALLKPETTVILDDGAASVEVQKNYLLQGEFKYKKKPLRKGRLGLSRFLYRRYDMDPILENHLQMFTCFPISEAVDKNIASVCDFSFLRTQMRTVERVEKAVFYFGSKYSEKGVLSLDDELKMLRSIYVYYRGFSDVEIVYYVPHRDDSPIKIQEIKRIGFVKRQYSATAEVALLKEAIHPARIGAAYSSILITLRMLLPQIWFSSFVIPTEWVPQQFREGVCGIYDYYQREGIPLLDWVDGQFVERIGVSESAGPVESTS